MMGKTHLLSGIVGGMALANVAFDGIISGVLKMSANGTLNANITVSGGAIVFTLGTILGSRLNDIDHPNSKYGKKLGIVSSSINKIFGHRGFTHTLIPIAILIAISVFGVVSTYTMGFTQKYLTMVKGGNTEVDLIKAVILGLVVNVDKLSFGLAIGMLIHDFGDMLTKAGVPILYPIFRKKLSVAPFETNGMFEKLLFLTLLVVLVPVFLMNIKVIF